MHFQQTFLYIERTIDCSRFFQSRKSLAVISWACRNLNWAVGLRNHASIAAGGTSQETGARRPCIQVKNCTCHRHSCKGTSCMILGVYKSLELTPRHCKAFSQSVMDQSSTVCLTACDVLTHKSFKLRLVQKAVTVSVICTCMHVSADGHFE